MRLVDGRKERVSHLLHSLCRLASEPLYQDLRMVCQVYSVQCVVYSMLCTVCSVQCTMCSVKCAVFSVQCMIRCVQCTVCTMNVKVYTCNCSVHCTVQDEEVQSSMLLVGLVFPHMKQVMHLVNVTTKRLT